MDKNNNSDSRAEDKTSLSINELLEQIDFQTKQLQKLRENLEDEIRELKLIRSKYSY